MGKVSDNFMVILFIICLIFGPGSVQGLSLLITSQQVHPMIALAIGTLFGWATIPANLFLTALAGA